MLPAVDLQKYVKLGGEAPPPKLVEEFYAQDPTPEIRVVLSAALEAGIISPDITFLAYLQSAMTDNQLFAISIALRHGANPNMYINSPEVQQPVHCLIYVHVSWKAKHQVTVKEDRLVMLVLTMLALGSDPMLPAIDPQGGALRPANVMIDARYPTVIEWLDKNRYSGYSKNAVSKAYPDIRAGTTSDTLKQVIMLSGRIDLIGDLKFTEADAKLMMLARSDDQTYVRGEEGPNMEQVDLISFLPTPTNLTGLDYEIIYDAIKFYDDRVIEFYANRGVYMSYPTLNILLLRIRQYQRTGNTVLRDIFVKVLEVSVANGLELDTEQRALLSVLPTEVYNHIIELHSIPYWQKECSHDNLFNDRVADRLLGIAREVELEPQDHASVCLQLTNMGALSPDVLKETSRLRQRARISAQHAYLSEFTGGLSPSLSCYNESEIDGDPFDYTELSLAHYRDIRGDLYCFPSDRYDSMLDNKTNPITNELLPESFLDNVRYKRDRIIKEGFDPRNPRKYSETIDKITKNDSVSDAESKRQVDLFVNEMAAYGVTRVVLEKMTAENYGKATDDGGYMANIRYLTRNHTMITTAYIVNGFMLRDPTRAKTIMASIARVANVPPPMPRGSVRTTRVPPGYVPVYATPTGSLAPARAAVPAYATTYDTSMSARARAETPVYATATAAARPPASPAIIPRQVYAQPAVASSTQYYIPNQPRPVPVRRPM